MDLAQETFSACLVAMPSCDPSTLAVARAGELLARNVARINEWNAAGYTVRNRDQFRYVIEEVTVAPTGAQAAALVCIADGSDLVQPAAGPGGADVVIDDSFTSGRESWDMRLDPDGQWRAFDAPAVGPTESTDVCPPSSTPRRTSRRRVRDRRPHAEHAVAAPGSGGGQGSGGREDDVLVATVSDDR